MDDSNKTPPPYAAYYGMAREPFGSTIEDELFYAEPTRKQRLDILLHLAQYGNELMLVTGPEGSGKTTLLQQFQNKALDSWSIAHIDAKEGMDERKLVQQLYHQMGMKFHGATHTELLENMGRHFNSLQHSLLTKKMQHTQSLFRLMMTFQPVLNFRFHFLFRSVQVQSNFYCVFLMCWHLPM